MLVDILILQCAFRKLRRCDRRVSRMKITYSWSCFSGVVLDMTIVWYDVRPLVLNATRRRYVRRSEFQRENGRLVSNYYSSERMMKNEMNARCEVLNVAVPPKKQAGRRLGAYDVDIDEGDMSAAARFLGWNPCPRRRPLLSSPATKDVDDQDDQCACDSAAAMRLCACCHYNRGRTDEMVLELLELGVGSPIWRAPIPGRICSVEEIHMACPACTRLA
jgi:hypothetical protein